MDTQQRTSTPSLIALTTVGLLLTMYFGGYAYLVQPLLEVQVQADGTSNLVHKAQYPFEGSWADYFFWPANQLDRQIRRESWKQVKLTERPIVAPGGASSPVPAEEQGRLQ